MPKKVSEANALAVSRLKKPGRWAVGGVAGLCLQVTDSGARSWIYRTMIGGKRTEVGLGGFPDVTLAGAREAARAMRVQIKAGVNPVAEFKSKRSALQAAAAAEKTFDECAELFIEAKTPEWSNPKHAAQWTATLATYASPIMGKLLVRDIELAHVLDVLRPIWSTKNETATRVRGRIESVLDWASVNKYRDGLNPARWKGHLDHLLPKPSKVSKVEHHAALPINDVGAFMVRLRAMEGTGARCLEFAILTAARSGEVRGARWSEIDIKAKTWVVPAARMKMGREHRVPLSDAALALLKAQPKIDGNHLVFPAVRGGQLSDMTLSACMRRMKVDAVPHGFRSTFRDWASERTDTPRDVAEMALAHAIGDKVEAAYRRGDLFDKRTLLMQQWADFCGRAHKRATVSKLPAGKRNPAA